MKVEMSMEQSNTHTHTKMAYTQRGEERERRRKKYGSRVNQTKITVINLRLSMDRQHQQNSTAAPANCKQSTGFFLSFSIESSTEPYIGTHVCFGFHPATFRTLFMYWVKEKEISFLQQISVDVEAIENLRTFTVQFTRGAREKKRAHNFYG